MSKSQTIAQLEALLSRVLTRAAEPRAKVVLHPPAAIDEVAQPMPAVTVAEEPPPVATEAPPPAAPSPAPALAASILDLDDPGDDLESTAARMVPSRPAPRTTEADIVLDVEVQASTHETVIAVPVEEAIVPDALESRERLVAAEPSPVEAAAPEPALGELTADAPEMSSGIAVQIDEPAIEIEEAPASSRRPVAPPPEERLDEMAFGNVEPQPPRHTPPPESGRLPAAPEVEFDGDITGVRNAAKPVRPSAPVSIVPEATMADLSASTGAVADVVGAVAAPAPATFLAVLDLSLAL